LNEDEQMLLRQELNYLEAKKIDDLYTSVIHADLFRDNVLFIDNELTGIIDFYYAYNGFSIYDLAVTVNDWCTTGDKNSDKENIIALLLAYQTIRRIDQNERDAWCYFLRLAALRFWLSRLWDKYFPRGGEITHIKDPDRFRLIVQERSENEDEIMSIWDCC
jgi:homoserine kinase type II